MSRGLSTMRVACMLIAAAIWARPAAAAEAEWEEIIHQDGIKVWERPIAGSGLVEFRGRGVIEAPMVRVAAVLRSSGKEKEWMEGCVDSRPLTWRSPIHAVVYHRLASPAFFVSDRDMVVEARTTLLPEQASVRIDFESVKHERAPELDGVVRVRQIAGHWVLTRLEAGRTEVEYQVRADPSGDLPHFLVNWVTQKVPLETIRGLRSQANAPGYELDVAILEQAIDFDALGTRAAAPADISPDRAEARLAAGSLRAPLAASRAGR